MDHWFFRVSGKVTQTHVRGTLCTNNAQVVHAWALAGCGVAPKAHWDIEDDLRTGRLVELLGPYACDEIKLYAAYSSRQYLLPRTRMFVDFMAKSLGGAIYPSDGPGPVKKDVHESRGRKVASPK